MADATIFSWPAASTAGALSSLRMSEPQSDGRTGRREPRHPRAEAVGDALRSAVERTLAATADSATGTRERAQGLLDDVVRRGQSAREQVTKRGEGATNRLADAIADLRAADGADLEQLAERLGEVEARLRAVEARIAPLGNRVRPKPLGG